MPLMVRIPLPVAAQRAANRNGLDSFMILRHARKLQTHMYCRSASLHKQMDYIDEWQASIVKSPAFYESHAKDTPKSYFYYIDLQGRVFLEETLPKNITTSLKSQAFLDFFISNLSKSSESDLAFLPEHVRADYPYVSHCGRERNFVRPADLPIVFHAIVEDDHAAMQLCFGARLQQPFDPRCLAISRRTGHLYHQLFVGPGSKLLRKTGTHGLVKSSVAITLAERIVRTENNDLGSGMEFDSGESLYTIPYLPDSAEPGSWAMPSLEL